MSFRTPRSPAARRALCAGRRRAQPFGCFRALLAGVLVALCSLGSGSTRAEVLTDYEVKAAYLYNLAKFVTWPSLPDGELTLCVVGPDPFGPALDALAGRTVQERSLRVLRGPSTREPGRCQLAFVSERSLDPQLLATLAGAGTVTVSDATDFLVTGGMVAIQIVDNRLQFEINLAPSGRSGIKFSAQLLKLARRVTGTN